MHSAIYHDLTPAKLTYFQGRWYRSRSEAKWAVIFTHLHLPFYYEPELVPLPSGDYLPDFYLPTMDSYIEVKPHDVADPRYAELGLSRTSRVYLVHSNLPEIPRSWRDDAELYEHLRGAIHLKWPYDEPDQMLAREAQGRINIVPIASSSLAVGSDKQILWAYIIASSFHFPERPETQ